MALLQKMCLSCSKTFRGTDSRCPNCKALKRMVSDQRQRSRAMTEGRSRYDGEYTRNRRELLRENSLCFFCTRYGPLKKGQSIQSTTADHIVPLAKGGSNAKSNLIPSCAAHNYHRGDRDLGDYCRYLADRLGITLQRQL